MSGALVGHPVPLAATEYRLLRIVPATAGRRGTWESLRAKRLATELTDKNRLETSLYVSGAGFAAHRGRVLVQ